MPEEEETTAELLETRRRLHRHTEALLSHEPYWNITTYQALQTLAELTSRNEAPATGVRFSRRMLDRLLERENFAHDLTRLAELGAFTPAARTSPWYRAPPGQRRGDR